MKMVGMEGGKDKEQRNGWERRSFKASVVRSLDNSETLVEGLYSFF
jgi:hypothetical protein